MDVTINRLDPNVPDPVESRRRAAGRFVRIAYATIVFGILAFFVIYFGAPLQHFRFAPKTRHSRKHRRRRFGPEPDSCTAANDVCGYMAIRSPRRRERAASAAPRNEALARC
jgi:hypothetical protein